MNSSRLRRSQVLPLRQRLHSPSIACRAFTGLWLFLKMDPIPHAMSSIRPCGWNSSTMFTTQMSSSMALKWSTMARWCRSRDLDGTSQIWPALWKDPGKTRWMVFEAVKKCMGLSHYAQSMNTPFDNANTTVKLSPDPIPSKLQAPCPFSPGSW